MSIKSSDLPHLKQMSYNQHDLWVFRKVVLSMANKQLPLFPSQPSSQDEISKHTPIGATYDHFKRYLTKEGKSQHTIKAFISDMKLLADYTGDEIPVGEYTTTKLNAYLQWMEHDRGVSCSRKTYARRVTSLKVYFKWLRLVNAIPHDPSAAVLQRSGPAPLSKVLDQQQVQDIIATAAMWKKGDDHDSRPAFLFQLLLQTGIKKSEAGRLTLKDIDRTNPEHPVLMIRHKRKNIYKERRITLTPDILSLLDAYLDQYAPKDTIFTCTTRNLEYILTDLGKAADIPFKLSFEVMRWTMGVRETRQGTEEDRIREKMGLSQTSWYETSNKIRRLVAHQVKTENSEVS